MSNEMTKVQDFPSMPQYQMVTNRNESWVAVTLTRSNEDGSKTQVQAIAPKVR